MSFCSRPSIASRTGPPTRARRCPAASNLAPSSSTTSATRASSRAARACTSTIERGSGDEEAGGTRDHPRDPPRPVRRSTGGRRWSASIALPGDPSTAPPHRGRGDRRCGDGRGRAWVPCGRLPAARPRRRPGDESENGDPLTVTIDRLTPGAVPTRGPVTVRGRVTNSSDEEWRELAVYLVTSREPITDRAELAAAVASDPLSECPQVCSRLVDPGLFVDVPDLAPGESAPSGSRCPGTGWGSPGTRGSTGSACRCSAPTPRAAFPGADGRARTFLPLVPPRVPGHPARPGRAVPQPHGPRRGRAAGVPCPAGNERWPARPSRRLLELADSAGTSRCHWSSTPPSSRPPPRWRGEPALSSWADPPRRTRSPR